MVQKMPSFFFHQLQFITVLLLICDSYMSWNTKFVSLKLCAEFSIFDSVLCFIIVYIFVQQHAWILWLYNIVIPIKIEIIKKPHTVLLPVLWFLSCNKKFYNSMKSAWVGGPESIFLRTTVFRNSNF